jgi:hypothetical protein
MLQPDAQFFAALDVGKCSQRIFEFRPASGRLKTGLRPAYWQSSPARWHRAWNAAVQRTRWCRSGSSQLRLARRVGRPFGIQIQSRACHQLSQTTAAAKWMAPRKLHAVLS